MFGVKAGRHAIRLWRAALVGFVVAAATGAVFRGALLFGIPAGWNLGYIRHAHSHLMYMGWATPALMALLLPAAAMHRAECGRLARAHALIWASWTGALLAYLAFLWSGYDLVSIGEAELPLAAIVSGVNVLLWYGFAGVLWAGGVVNGRSTSGRLSRLALALLLLSTAGAWGRAALPALGLTASIWADLSVHLFLDLFAEGWLTVGVLALMFRALPDDVRANNWGMLLVVIGAALMPLLSLPAADLSPPLVLASRVGPVLLGAGLLSYVPPLWRELKGAWRLPLLLLVAKSLMLFAIALSGSSLAAVPGLRILYLHTSLLGFVTLGLIAAARQRWGERAAAAPQVMAAAVLLVLLSLILLVSANVLPLPGQLVLHIALYAALAPLLAAVWMLIAPAVRPRAGARVG